MFGEGYLQLAKTSLKQDCEDVYLHIILKHLKKDHKMWCL